jgi:hypothetical protein
LLIERLLNWELGLTCSYLKEANYHAAIDAWPKRHGAATVFCFVQFKNVRSTNCPGSISPVPQRPPRDSAKGGGDTILCEEHTWGTRAVGPGMVEQIPEAWRFTAVRRERFAIGPIVAGRFQLKG